MTDNTSRGLELGLVAGRFETKLRFNDSQEVAVQMTNVASSWSIRMNELWSTRMAVGLAGSVGRLGLFAECSGLGERTVKAGISRAW